MAKQVNVICKACYYQIHCIGSIRPYISTETCKTLVQALVISRLDYGNALLYGISLTLVSRLQRIQNSAARLVTCIRKRNYTCFAAVTLASSEVQIMVQNSAPHIQKKWADRPQCTSMISYKSTLFSVKRIRESKDE